VEFEIKTLRTALAVNLDLTDAQTARLQQLNELDEKRLDVIHLMQEHRQHIKRASVERKTAGQANTNFENALGLLRKS
jgi:hypothetical protein